MTTCANCRSAITWFEGGRHPKWVHETGKVRFGAPVVDKFCPRNKIQTGSAPQLAAPEA